MMLSTGWKGSKRRSNHRENVAKVRNDNETVWPFGTITQKHECDYIFKLPVSFFLHFFRSIMLIGICSPVPYNNSVNWICVYVTCMRIYSNLFDMLAMGCLNLPFIPKYYTLLYAGLLFEHSKK